MEKYHQVLSMVMEQLAITTTQLHEIKEDAAAPVMQIAENITQSTECQAEISRIIQSNIDGLQVVEQLLVKADLLETNQDEQEGLSDILQETQKLLQKNNLNLDELSIFSQKASLDSKERLALGTQKIVSSLSEYTMSERALILDIINKLHLINVSKESKSFTENKTALKALKLPVERLMLELNLLNERSQKEMMRLTEVLGLIQFQDVQKQRIERLLGFINAQSELLEEVIRNNRLEFDEYKERFEKLVEIFHYEESTHGRAGESKATFELELF